MNFSQILRRKIRDKKIAKIFAFNFIIVKSLV